VSDLSYVLPLRWTDDDELDDLTAYLRWLAPRVELIVVDGSPPPLDEVHRRAWRGLGRVIPPDPALRFRMGKVNGVLTGVRVARHDRVVVADDDVRYDAAGLERMAALLDGHEVVRPQNVFRPLPWQARWDTGRILLNRALGADFPGTLGVRRDVLLGLGGYDGDVMFENLELIRTVRAAGGREANARDLYVVRRPATVRHFLRQRVRNAYDDFAIPARMAAWLAIVPAVALSGRRRGAVAGGLAAATVAAAEFGRCRSGGRAHFPATSALWAPLWTAERAVCAWLALASRLRYGGVRYAGGVIPRAAHSERDLRERAGRPAPAPAPAP
jgi:hypothetical protein